LKWEGDGSLSFRKNCRNTICGSCAMRINGRSRLACKENVGQMLAQGPSGPPTTEPTIAIGPLGNLPVIKDLVVDLQPFWDRLEAIHPAVSRSHQLEMADASWPAAAQGETRQTPDRRALLEQAGNCIACGACYSECNALMVNPQFLGPQALAKAQRLVDDTRDQARADRLAQLGADNRGVWGCTRCMACNEVCPMEVAPLDRISQIKSAILANTTPAEADRPVRHRQTLVEMVRAGGWVDERQFALRVVGNGGRDWQGLASLGALGLRMLVRGKLPLSFERSTGTAEVRSLIDAVRAAEKSARTAIVDPPSQS
jgi:succinate dehydrogenase / fumarate reductase iron-sulfur subunit